jgi:hypothetical protein
VGPAARTGLIIAQGGGAGERGVWVWPYKVNNKRGKQCHYL